MKKIKDANIEALRIFAMSSIVIGHFFCHSGIYGVVGYDWTRLIHPFVSFGVDVFFLITGYFQIRLNIKGLLRIVFMVFLFNMINVFITVYNGWLYSPLDLALMVAFPISRSPYWFMQAYLGIVLLSPVLNAGVNAMQRKSLISAVTVFSAFTFYSCLFGRNSANVDGFTIVQGIYLYLVGSLIARERDVLLHIPRRWCFIGAGIVLYISGQIPITYVRCLMGQYNSPIMVLSSVLILVGFMQTRLKHPLVNTLGSGALGVYLLQDGHFGHKFLYQWQYEYMVDPNHSPAQTCLMYIAVFLGLWGCSAIVVLLFNSVFNTVCNRFSCSVDLQNNVLAIKERALHLTRLL